MKKRAAPRILSAALAAALAFLLLPAAAQARAFGDLTGECTVKPDAGSVSRLIDGDMNTYDVFSAGIGLNLSWSEKLPAAVLRLIWYEAPDNVRVDQYGADGALLRQTVYAEEYLEALIALESGCVSVRVESDGEFSISEVGLYSQQDAPEARGWQPSAEKADILVISAHPDDEQLYFGSVMPIYAGEAGLTVQVAYMTHQQRLRQSEAVEGLWTSGVQNYPVFLGYPDIYSTSLEQALTDYDKDDVVRTIVRLIRRCRPEVVVTHDLEGEYGHGMHRLTAQCAMEAVLLAGDTGYDAQSVEMCGAWEVQKLYLHVYGDAQILLDGLSPLAAFDGQSAYEVAQAAYICHHSQESRFSFKVSAEGRLNFAMFGLVYSAVGADVLGGDLLENIPAERLTTYVAPTPAPTDESAPTDTPAPRATDTPAPVASAAPTAESVPADAGAPRTGLLIALLAALLVLIVLSLLLIRLRRRKNP